MTLKTLFKKLDKVYHDEGFIRQNLKQADGDTLALFIVREISDAIQNKNRISLKAMAEAHYLMEKAKAEITRIEQALCVELYRKANYGRGK